MSKKTKERILNTALSLFNEQGEANITTNAIALEMDISPGNLHYHFKTKEVLVESLIRRFYASVSALMVLDAEEKVDVLVGWMRVHLLFELMWKHRFAYLDLTRLISKYPAIRANTANLLHEKISVTLKGLNMIDLQATDTEKDTLSRNMVALMSYWISFELACGVEGESEARFARGTWQVASLVIPYLNSEDKAAVKELAGDYLD